MQYEYHEYANLFPMMTDQELKALVDDMRLNGYDDTAPIITHHGKILDGRNRYKAAQVAGVAPVFEQFDGEDALGFVIRHNLNRRHLNESQRAVVASRLANMTKADAANTRWNATANLQLHEIMSESQRAAVAARMASQFPQMERETPQRELISQAQAAEMLNVSPRTVATIKAIEKKAPELLEKIEAGEMTASRAWTETKRKEVVANLESVEAREAKALDGVYDVIVIDPPWPMQKIEREVAPNQVTFEYPTMTLEEIADMEMPAADDCHLFLWTTQKYMPAALGIMAGWGFTYVLTFVWHKNGGFQPFGLPQYNCEFALYGRKGAPQFVDFKDFMTCFNAPRGAHSEKPEEFYATLRRVTAGRRVDMFNRRKIDGFDTWGKEAQ